MDYIANIKDIGTRSKSLYSIKWMNESENWTITNTLAGKFYNCQLWDEQKNELACLKYNLLKSMIVPHYGIYVKRKKCAEVYKKISLGFEFGISGNGYKILDNGSGEKWELYHADDLVAVITVINSNSDKMCYQVETDAEYRVMGVCTCIAIDLAMRVLIRSNKR